MAAKRTGWRRVGIIGLEVLAGLILGLVVLLGVAIWRLSTGPVSADFATPLIEDALSDPANGLQVKIGETDLIWEGWDGGVDIQVKDVVMTGPTGLTAVEVDTMSVAFSIPELMSGNLEPTRLEILRPTVFLTYGANGLAIGLSDPATANVVLDPTVQEGIDAAGADVDPDEQTVDADGDADPVDMMIAELRQPPSADRQLGLLQSLRITDADLRILDTVNDAVWQAPGASFELTRDDAGVALDASVSVALRGTTVSVEIASHFWRDTDRYDLTVGFGGLTPSLIASNVPYASDFEEFDIPVSGTLRATADQGDFDFVLDLAMPIDGQTGTIEAVGTLPRTNDLLTVNVAFGAMPLAELAERLPWLDALAGFDVRVTGDVEMLVTEAGVDSVGFELHTSPGMLVLQDVYPAPLPVDLIVFEGAIAGGGAAIDIGRLDIDFGDVEFNGSGTAFADVGIYDVTVGGVLSGMNIDNIETYWPELISANARTWVRERVPEGVFDSVSFNISGRHDLVNNAFKPTNLDLDFRFHDLAIVYVVGMPPATNLTGHGTYGGSELVINLEPGGETFDLLADEGQIRLSGLDEKVGRARIETTLSGDLRNHLRMIDHEPLSFLQAYGIQPGAAGGRASAKLELEFDLEEVVELDALDISVVAYTTNALVPGIAAGADLTDADLEVSVTNEQLRIRGRAVMLDAPVQVDMTENFLPGAPVLNQVTVQGVFDVQRLTEIGVDATRWGQGPVGTAARIHTYRDNTTQIAANMVLDAASVGLPILGWSKPPGVPAVGSIQVLLRDGDLETIDRVTIDTGDFSADVRIAFADDGAPAQFDIHTLEWGRTAVRGVVAASNGGYAIRADGGVVDLQQWLGDDAVETASPNEADGDPPVPLAISGRLDRLWIDDTAYVDNIAADVLIVDGDVQRGRVSGLAGVPVVAEITQEDSGRMLWVNVEDAGAVLSALGFTDAIGRGRLSLAARFRDNEPGQPLVGDLTIQNFRLIDAPVIAEIVAIAGITGIFDAIEGEGIGFGELSTTFRYRDGIVELRGGSMVGPSIGMTFDGAVDIENDLINLQGAVAPAYALNGLLEGIPLIGDILVGGPGEGIFAVTYRASGSAEDPEVAVNPLSALTPGVLRNIFPGG